MRHSRIASVLVPAFVLATFSLSFHSCSRPRQGVFPYEASVVDRFEAPVTLASLRGSPVVFVAYAASMPDCRRRIERLVALSDEFRNAGVKFAAVDISPAHADKFPEVVPDYRGDVMFLKDRNGEAGRALKVDITPTTFLVSADGIIRERIESVYTWDTTDFRRRVESLGQIR